MHHAAKRMIELEWDKELTGSFPMTLKLVITYQLAGSYFIEVRNTCNTMWTGEAVVTSIMYHYLLNTWRLFPTVQ